MILKSILICISLFVVWTLVLRAKPNTTCSQHQFQDNYIKTEKVLYGTHQKEKVIIGSSLSCRLNFNEFNDIVNLALSGQSILDGSTILNQLDTPPRIVFVEINVVMRPSNIDFQNSFTKTVPYQLKKNFYAFRSDKQPLSLAGAIVVIPIFEQLYEKISIGTKVPKPDSTLFDQLVAQQVAIYSKLPDSNFVTAQFTKLLHNIQQLEQKGSKIVFYEMPVNHQLIGLPLAQLVRTKFKTVFPPSRYPYIELPNDWDSYHTTDAVHLNDEESEKYTAYLKQQMALLNVM